ncbi:hypothetical protein ACJMK2_036497 [Sinanodonta woodiana]|uniref:Centriolar and ciliogenesis-associated protein HYLS1 C-terminal domain-containing protein n=1 Tax=Sinanodonta woodiana TaxID=1069815 RepID=A0ABD3WKV6_SINWO
MSDLDFTDDEIREELSKLGYSQVPDSRLQEFKKDLGILICKEKSKLSSQNSSLSSHTLPDTSISYTEPVVPKVTVQRERVPLEEASLTDRQGYSELHSHYIGHGKENRVELRQDFLRRNDMQPKIRRNDRYDMYEPELDPNHRIDRDLRDDISDTDSERRLVKRKVLRREKDGSKRIDESYTESETGSIVDINERLQQLGIADSVDFFDRGKSQQSSRDEPPYRLSPDDPRPASVILRQSEHPHTKNLRKSDPVARYQQFRQSWMQQLAPGEKFHKQLRWNVREQMLAQDMVYEKKPHRVYIPNSYKVPSDKKRQALRWQIRMDMAQGQMPQHGFYHEYH